MTDFRALCAELVEDIEEWMVATDRFPPGSVALVNRARAVLDRWGQGQQNGEES
jgi:hypothetical protein